MPTRLRRYVDLLQLTNGAAGVGGRRSLTIVTVAALALAACTRHTCDDFATLSFDVPAHANDPCSLVLAGAASTTVDYEFPPATMPSDCDGGTCTRASCTSDAGPAPSFCARTLDGTHDRIQVQLESDAVSAFIARIGARDYTATLTCAGATVVDHEHHSVDCIASSAP